MSRLSVLVAALVVAAVVAYASYVSADSRFSARFGQFTKGEAAPTNDCTLPATLPCTLL